MRFPATPGWVSLPVVVGVPRHSWLKAPGAVPRHSSLGSAGGSGVWSLATPDCGTWMRFPATPGLGIRRGWWWVAPRHSWVRVLGGCSFVFPGRGCQVRFPATPGSGAPAAAVAVSVGLGGRVSRVVCPTGAARARGVCAGVCVVCLWCLC